MRTQKEHFATVNFRKKAYSLIKILLVLKNSIEALDELQDTHNTER